MRILQINTLDKGGGAEAVALGLHQSYRALGHKAWLGVRKRHLDEPGIAALPETDGMSLPAKCLYKAAEQANSYSGRLGTWLKVLARPQAALDRWRGREDFDFPSTTRLLERFDHPQILQAHNLHGHYFDLRQLPTLCQRLPVVLTLHDAWLLSGHCAHSFSCDRWKTGCGHCPDLSIYPPVSRDATAFNWTRKRDIFAQCRLHVATPSDWLMRRVEQSMLAPAIQSSRVIPNSVDDVFFQAADRMRARHLLNLTQDAIVLLFAANTIRDNEWKDFAALSEALALVSQALPEREVVLLALGDHAPEQMIGRARLVFLPFRSKPQDVATCYQAADVYLHAAKAETFSLTIAEAQACGTPVVATRVGAIPERITCALRHPRDHATGILVSPGSGAEMAKAALQVLIDSQLAASLSRNGRIHAEQTYRRTSQAETYLGWFAQLVAEKS